MNNIIVKGLTGQCVDIDLCGSPPFLTMSCLITLSGNTCVLTDYLLDANMSCCQFEVELYDGKYYYTFLATTSYSEYAEGYILRSDSEITKSINGD